MAGFENPIVGGIALRIPAIRSPNYVAGSTGWTINIDGSVEFNNGTFRGTVTAGTFQGTNFVINSSGAFFYSGTPAAGNLVASITPASGTDSFLNPYLTGLTSYGNAAQTFSEMAGGNVLVGNINSGVPDTTDAGVMQALGPLMIVRSPVNASPSLVRDGCRLTLQSGQTAQTTGSANAPYLSVLGDDLASDADVKLSGSVIKTTQGFTAYTWQVIGSGGSAPAFGTNWLTSTTFNGSTSNQALRIRLGAEDTLVIEGAFKAGAVAPGATVFNAAAPYRPVNNFWVNAWRNRAGTVIPLGLQFTNGGNFNVFGNMGGGAPAASDEYWVPRQEISLGNIP